MYYKVLRETNSILHSMSYALDSDISVKYKLYEWAFPLTGTNGLFVFKDLDFALDFTGPDSKYSFYECKVKNPRKIHYRANLYKKEILSFWELYKNIRSKHKSITSVLTHERDLYRAPHGAYIASAVKIIRKINIRHDY